VIGVRNNNQYTPDHRTAKERYAHVPLWFLHLEYVRAATTTIASADRHNHAAHPALALHLRCCLPPSTRDDGTSYHCAAEPLESWQALGKAERATAGEIMAEAYVVLRWTVRRSTVPGLLVSRVAGGQIAHPRAGRSGSERCAAHPAE